MRQKLSNRNLLLVGFTLFSMFFGAGNLIFPPFLGAMAGERTWSAMAGFLISAVGLPVLGVAAVAMSGGLRKLAGRVHPWFAFLFTLLIYLSIGPCLAIPRTAGTSFEMAVLPYLGENGLSVSTAQLLYSVAFFAIAMILALKPEKLTDRLGKILCPTLLVLIAVIFTGCLVWPLGPYGAADASYARGAVAKGFLEGYQTMDTIAALNFGIIIAMNIQAKGVKEEGAVVRETIKAGVIAGVLMALVYAALAHVGAPTARMMSQLGNGARILTFVADHVFGRAGMILLGLIFFIACLNTCVGLLSSCSKYFSTVFPVLGYRAWLAVFGLVSMVVSNVGLNRILAFSVPVLNMIYPVAIVLIALAFLDPLVGRWHYVYPCSILLTGIVSVLCALDKRYVPEVVMKLPGYASGLGWILPALAGLAAGIAVSAAAARQKSI